MATRINGNHLGRWVDGARSLIGARLEAIDIARGYGFKMPVWFDPVAADIESDDEGTAADAWQDIMDLSNEAAEYLAACCLPGVTIEWIDGNLVCYRLEDDI